MASYNVKARYFNETVRFSVDAGRDSEALKLASSRATETFKERYGEGTHFIMAELHIDVRPK